MKKYLPLGSVVTLKNGNKKIMICGRVQEEAATKQIFDYCAVYYPEGLLNPKELFLFNNEDVDLIYYVGMQDEEEFLFCEFMNEKLENLE